MIRTPEAKRQAEILITEMAKHGTTLKRGHALDIVAKQQGYKGWNELVAASSTIIASPPAQYAVPGLTEIARHGQIQDINLAGLLRHGRDQTTDLLAWTAPDGETYVLRLCGRAQFDYTAPDGSCATVRSSDGLQAYQQALSKVPRDARREIDNPFFEWVTSEGCAVGEVFEEISVNAQEEVESFQRMLAHDNSAE